MLTVSRDLSSIVYQVPEAASLLIPGGVKPAEFTDEENEKFQENLLKTILQLEQTYYDLADTCQTNCLIICDRGAMDAKSFCSDAMWERIMQRNNLNTVQLRDERYNQIIHLMTAANGALPFYLKERNSNPARTENQAQAIYRDERAKFSWLGNPYYDFIDNSTDFERKQRRVKEAVCNRMGIEIGDRLEPESKKRKFLIQNMPEDEDFPSFQDFEVEHHYIESSDQDSQVRIRKRGQKGYFTYTYTVRSVVNGQVADKRKQLSRKEYDLFCSYKRQTHCPIYKLRRCFSWNNTYFHLDIYKEPCLPGSRGMIILETYTTKRDKLDLPQFLKVTKEITNDRKYSMYTLSCIELSHKTDTPSSAST